MRFSLYLSSYSFFNIKRSLGDLSFIIKNIKNIKNNVLPKINAAPTSVFTVTGSPKKTTAIIIAIATPVLSTGTTCETFPNCRL
ncbi:hypothetical protein [Segetibacter aerophilus]|uniref:hypothetical protein n=1 Tax=Segetibacter aerophilus TaxID=670293 RepID=UPI001581FB06|nr:hypothetical protein [Segetibacter aerophilus]